MANPSYAQLRSNQSIGSGFLPETVQDRILTVLSMMACAQNPDGSSIVSVSGTPVQASSGLVTAATATATLPGVAGKTTYITGFTCTGTGATSLGIQTLTITGLASTLSYAVTVPALVSLATGVNLNVSFPQPLPASALNTAIVVSVPSFGVGNTGAAVSAYGFQA